MSTNKKVSASLITICIVAFAIVSIYLSMVYVKLRPSDSDRDLMYLRTTHAEDSVQLESYKSELTLKQSELSECKLQLNSFKDSVGYQMKMLKDSLTKLNR